MQIQSGHSSREPEAKCYVFAGGPENNAADSEEGNRGTAALCRTI